MKHNSFSINKFGRMLSYYLKYNGISQNQLAEMLGKSQQCISRWINGEREPRLDYVLFTCQILKKSPNELLGFNDISDAEFEKYASGSKSKK